MTGEKRLHMIFLLILILATIMVSFLFSGESVNEGFGNEILDIKDGTYNSDGTYAGSTTGKNNGSGIDKYTPMDPGAGYYAINVGTVDLPIWKRKSIPYGYQVDPADKSKLVGKTYAAIETTTPTITDVEILKPPFLNIPGATYSRDGQSSEPNYGAGIIPPASGFYKIQIITQETPPITKYFMKKVPDGYVVDRKDLLIDNINPGTDKKYTKLIFHAPEVSEDTIMSTTGAIQITDTAIASDTLSDGYFIINKDGTYYKKLIPNGYDISSNDPDAIEYKKLPTKYTPLKYNPNFTPDKTSIDKQTTYDAKNMDTTYHSNNPNDASDNNMGKYWMFDSEGKLIEVDTQNDLNAPILYYIPGAYKFGASNYVPNYEDSVYLSRTTRQSQLAPVVNTASQLGGFCSQYKGNTSMLEEKCAAQDLNACASTSCCVLLGGQKCVAGNQNGPKNPANYTDYSLKNRDFYYYQGKCFGNCL